MVAICHRRKAGPRKSHRRNPRFPLVYAVPVGREGPNIYQTLKEFKANVFGHTSWGKTRVFACIKKAKNWLAQLKRKVVKDAAPSSLQDEIHTSKNSSTPPRIRHILTPSGIRDLEDQAVAPVVSFPASPAIVTKAISNEILHVQILSPNSVPLYDRMEDVEPFGVNTDENDENTSAAMSGSESLPCWKITSRLTNTANNTAQPESADVFVTTPAVQELVANHGKNLSTDQMKVLCAVAEGQSIFFTGAAGTGKSLTLRSIIGMLRCKYLGYPGALAVTASTGIAALNIGGETLHSFAGVGLGKKPIEELLHTISQKASEKWGKVKTLIIDEISMVDGNFFDKLETIARHMRKKRGLSKLPFGGVQLVICGDFFQLPPVPDQYNGAPVPATFAFEALSWRRCISLQMRLTQVFRQADPVFVEILNNMRLGKVNADVELKLRHLERDVAYNGIDPVHIYPRNYQVENENTSRLKALSGRLFSNRAEDRGRWMAYERADDLVAHQKRITNLLDKFSNAPGSVELKEGAQVMLIRNLVPGQLVNGSLGRVVGLSSVRDAQEKGIRSAVDILEASLQVEAATKTNHKTLDELRRMRGIPKEIPDIVWPIVEFTDGRKVLFTPLLFDMEDAFGDLEATRVQVPLILGWAITVHKSQGQTIERLKIDFRGTFETGQAYVAMSRSTGLETLQVLNFESTMVRAHPRVLQWYNDLLFEGEMDREEAIIAYFSQY